MSPGGTGTPSGGIVVTIATLGPLGRLPAPGTWGALAGVPWAALLWLAPIPATVSWVLLAGGLLLAVWTCGEAERRIGRRDPGCIVLDEFASMPLCLIGWSRLVNAFPAWAIVLAGFLVFRVLDISKPLGIRRLQNAPGGWGVVLDDVAAALLTAAVVHAFTWLRNLA